MTKTVATRPEERGAVAELADDVRESAKAGQHAASEALRKFRRTVDEAIPETVQPLRKTIVDAAIEFADQLVTAQYRVQPKHCADRGPGTEQVRRNKRVNDRHVHRRNQQPLSADHQGTTPPIGGLS